MAGEASSGGGTLPISWQAGREETGTWEAPQEYPSKNSSPGENRGRKRGSGMAGDRREKMVPGVPPQKEDWENEKKERDTFFRFAEKGPTLGRRRSALSP